MVDALPQTGEKGGFRDPGDLGQEPMGDRADGGGHCAGRGPGIAGEGPEPGGQDRLQRCRQVVSRPGGGEKLLHEERVALRASPDLFEDLRVRPVAQDRGQQGGDVGLSEPVEGQESGPAAAAQLRQQRPEGMAGNDRLAPDRHDHQRPRTSGEVGQQEPEEVPRRAVGPVQVVEQQHDGGVPPGLFEPVQDLLEVPRPVAHRAIPARVGGRERAERFDERPVGRAGVAAVDAPTDQHPRSSFGGHGGELPQESRLPGAALALDHDGGRPALAGVVQCGHQSGQLRPTAHEGGGWGGSHASL